MKGQILVLGLGNILLRDEGLGVRACERLIERHDLPPEVVAMDGGTLGLDLLPYVADATHLLLIDAVAVDEPPGTIVRLEGDAIPQALAHKMSMHQVGVQELLAISRLQDTLPAQVVLWGMVPAQIEHGIDLSSTVAKHLDALIEAVVAEMRRWGVQVVTK